MQLSTAHAWPSVSQPQPSVVTAAIVTCLGALLSSGIYLWLTSVHASSGSASDKGSSYARRLSIALLPASSLRCFAHRSTTLAHHRQARGLEALDHHCTSFFVRVPMGRGGSFYITLPTDSTLASLLALLKSRAHFRALETTTCRIHFRHPLPPISLNLTLPSETLVSLGVTKDCEIRFGCRLQGGAPSRAGTPDEEYFGDDWDESLMEEAMLLATQPVTASPSGLGSSTTTSAAAPMAKKKLGRPPKILAAKEEA